MSTKIDTRALKAKHRLELVMQEAGERFEIDPENTDRLRSLVTHGLVVDIRNQTYELTIPGMELEKGDVYSWLQRRYSWTFRMALRFLERRTPDPKTKQDKSIKIDKQPTINIEEKMNEPVDDWQRKALKIGGDDISDYFSKSYGELLQILSILPARFLSVIAADIDECADCGEDFNWKDPKTTAYFCEDLNYWRKDMPEDERNKFILDLEIEGVICRSCMHEKVSHYLAVSYCCQSAWDRWVEKEDQSKRVFLPAP